MFNTFHADIEQDNQCCIHDRLQGKHSRKAARSIGLRRGSLEWRGALLLLFNQQRVKRVLVKADADAVYQFAAAI